MAGLSRAMRPGARISGGLSDPNECKTFLTMSGVLFVRSGLPPLRSFAPDRMRQFDYWKGESSLTA